jgi:hypothetical protein
MSAPGPTPGQIAYTVYSHMWLRMRPSRVMLTWTELSAEDRHAWDAAAQAVLTQCQAQEDTP